jgi:hypothetical protein
MTTDSNTDLVKVTIRLPRAVVMQAKVHALALDDDLQDFVARVLQDYFRTEPIPASLAHVLKRKGRKKAGQ